MPDPSPSPTPEWLIAAAVPMLEDVEHAWVVPQARKRMARAMRRSLESRDGPQIAGLIAPYFNPFEKIARGHGDDSPVNGAVDEVRYCPGDTGLCVCSGEQAAYVDLGGATPAKVTCDGQPVTSAAALLAFIAKGPCMVTATVTWPAGEEDYPDALEAHFVSGGG